MMIESPSKIQMAKNLTSEVIASSRNAILGKPVFVSAEIAQERFSICLSCEQLQKQRCKLCGCFMEKKTNLASAKCPIDKWAIVEEQ